MFSVWTTERSVAPRLAWSTWTGVNASSYQKLCRSSVDRRSAAASSVSAASGHHAGSAERLAAVSWAAAGAATASLTGRLPWA